MSAAAPLLPEMIVDSFAGGGGASEGIKIATGRGPDLAINHDAHAVQVHQLNHPHCLHLCEDVFEVDPCSVCAGRRVGLAWFSPDCTHFSRAKSGKPVDSKIRGLAWVVRDWAKAVHPRVNIIENVQEFLDWGPLDENDKPIKARKGETFRRWVAALRAEGYAVDWKILVASDYGAPTSRERLFIIARNDGLPIVWPEPTHGKDGLEPVGAHTCIDWTIMGTLVTETSNVLKTRQRLEQGNQRYLVNDPDPYITRLPDGRLVGAWIARHYTGMVGRSIREPMSTITKVDHHGLVTTELIPDRKGPIKYRGKKYRLGDTYHRMLQPRELATAMSFGEEYALIGNKRAQTARIGNAVCPLLAAAVVAANYTPE